MSADNDNQKKVLGLEWNIFFTGITSFFTDTTTKMVYAILLPASIVAGLLYDKVDNRAPFYFGSAMAFTAAMLMFWFYKRRF